MTSGSEGHSLRNFLYLVLVAVVSTIIADAVSHGWGLLNRPDAEVQASAGDTPPGPGPTTTTDVPTTTGAEGSDQVTTTEGRSTPSIRPTTLPPPTAPPTTAPYPQRFYLDVLRPNTQDGFYEHGAATVGGTSYEHSLAEKVSSCHGDVGAVEFNLAHQFTRFDGLIGLRDDSQEVAAAKVEVAFDGQVVLSQTIRRGEVIEVPHNVSGVLFLRITAQQTVGSDDCSIATGNNHVVIADGSVIGPSDKVGSTPTTSV